MFRLKGSCREVMAMHDYAIVNSFEVSRCVVFASVHVNEMSYGFLCSYDCTIPTLATLTHFCAL